MRTKGNHIVIYNMSSCVVFTTTFCIVTIEIYNISLDRSKIKSRKKTQHTHKNMHCMIKVNIW
jgi:hypothetical protein